MLYVDGDARGFRERRRPESSGAGARSQRPPDRKLESRFSRSDAVWAKTYYPGAIEKVHEDATYDILYEDGEREARVWSADLEDGLAANCISQFRIANDDAEAVAKRNE